MSLELAYFYGSEAEQYSFYRIPKVLLTDRRYKSVSMEAKVLYGLMLDRMGLSVRSGWLDSEGRVYIYFTLEDALAMLGCGKDKAVRLFKELDVTGGIGLIERRNAEALAGSQMRYDFTVANTSNVPLEDFYWHDRIPTDAARATVFTTGTYSARLNYRVLYKTNYSTTYQVLASNLLTSSSYSFSLNAIPTQAGEYVTDVYLDFGKVPVGFQSTSSPTLTVQIHGTAANGYQLVNRADVGGKYQGTWQTAQASWVTIVRKYGPTPSLPKTGY